MRGTLLLLVSSLLLFSVSAEAQERIDLKGWSVVSKSNISVRVSDDVIYYLGFDLKYRNPSDPDEYVRQVRVIRPFIVVKSKDQMDKNLVDAAIAYVTDSAEKELLGDYMAKSDPILEIHWREKYDHKRGATMLDGENSVWLWNASGFWVYMKNTVVKSLMLSETLSEIDGDLVIVGQKYSLNSKVYHAHEVPHAFIVLALRAGKGGK